MVMNDALFQPIDGEDPCGEDISASAVLYQLDTLVGGKPETQFSAAQEPDWRAIEKLAAATLQKSKHLSVFVIYAVALLRLRGLEGAAEGLDLLSSNLKNYWEGIYPRLDPADNNDPTERLSLLAALTAPLGAGDNIRFIERLRSATLFKSQVLGAATLEGLDGAGESATGQFRAAIAAEPAENVAALTGLAKRLTASVESMISFLDEAVEPRYRCSWALLSETVKKVEALFASDGVIEVEDAPEAEEATQEGVPSNSSPATMTATRSPKPTSATIDSREDVIRTLDKLCDYYKKNEPASPVPLLLKRAKGLVQKNFLEIVEDISPEALAQIKNLAGIRE